MVSVFRYHRMLKAYLMSHTAAKSRKGAQFMTLKTLAQANALDDLSGIIRNRQGDLLANLKKHTPIIERTLLTPAYTTFLNTLNREFADFQQLITNTLEAL